jgi:hypothetical protein
MPLAEGSLAVFNLFKVRDRRSSPDELLHYCAKNNLPALSLLTLLANISVDLANTTTKEARRILPLFQTYFSYLLGFAVWSGAKTGKFDITFDSSNGQSAIENLPDEDSFTSAGASAGITRILRHFYGRPENLTLARGHFGCYRSNRDSQDLANRIRAVMVQTFLWKKWSWDEQKHAIALSTINQEHCSSEIETQREFWNIALISEATWDVALEPMQEALKLTELVVLMTTATKTVREVVLSTDYPFAMNR